MYFTKQEISSNINSQYGINNQLQLSLTNGNVQFIIQLSRQLKISYTIPSLALHISQIFFQKRCYLFYDRFLILTASFALASKLKDMDCRLKSVCNSYYNIISRMTMNYEPFNEEKMKKIQNEICIAETQILRTLQYKIDFYTPHDYLKKYVQTLAQPKQTIRKVYNASRIIILDSYRSKCCLLYNPLTISIAALLIASRYQGFRPYVCEMVKQQLKNQQMQSKPIEKEESEQGQIGKDQEHDSAKNQLNNHQQLYKCWIKMIKDKEEEDLKEADILDCIRMINSVIFDTLKHWN